MFSIGKVGIGLLFTLCQVGGGWGIAIGQAVSATKVIYAQIGLAAWNVYRAQVGISLGSAIVKGNKLFSYDGCCCYCKRVSRGVHGIMNSLKYPSYWPEDAKKWMAEAIRNESTENVIKSMVNGCVKKKYHGLHNCTADELEQVIDRLIQKKCQFKQRAMANFPSNNESFGTITMV